jgi:putative ABC transport system permease protein
MSKLKNYFKVAARNLLRHKAYSFLNLFGLAVGMTCCILIALYIQDELRYDRYAPSADRIYRLALETQTRDRGVLNTARTPPPWAPALADDYPEVESYVRIKTPLVSWMISHEPGDKRFHEKGFYFADPSIFGFFGFRMVKGDPETALKEPRTAVLTETAARKYFGGEDPLGKIIRADNTYDFRVTGVVRDVPRNSHFSFDILASFESLRVLPIYNGNAYLSFQANGLNPDVYTYLRLKKGYRPADFEKKIPGFLAKYLAGQIARVGLVIKPFLQPLTGIHLHSDIGAEIKANSSIDYIYIFAAVGVFILLIACINFMNLATARSAGRAQEVGLRKVMGAERRQLIGQFMGETLFLSVLALGLALLFAQALLPIFQTLSGKTLSLNFFDVGFVLALLGITILVGLIAGSYPALFLSSFRPANVMKGSFKSGQANALLRKALVVFQFAISIIFIVGTAVVAGQLRYVQNKRLGFAKEAVVVLPLGDPKARVLYKTFKEEARRSPDVLAVAGAGSLPGGLTDLAFVQPGGSTARDPVAMESIICDYDFLEALGIELAAGRNFSLQFPTDPLRAFILNETAVKLLGWESRPLDQEIRIGNLVGRVIGVVKDFHVKSLHARINPLFLHLAPVGPDPLHYLAVKIRPGNVPRAMTAVEQAWRKTYPLDPFVYSFLADDFDALYRSEALRGRVFLAFTVLTVFIACLGLFGLASYTAEQRAREIGIRKVLGASESKIVLLLSSEFAKLVLLANAAAWPAAYFVMRGWLQGFAYRMGIPVGIFPAAAALALFIALLTVGGQAIRAARANPIEAIRAE